MNNLHTLDRLKRRFLKPHFTKTPTGWQCDAQGVRGTGQTMRGAYSDWLSHTRPAQPQWMPEQIRWTPHQPIQWPSNAAPWTPPFFNVTCGVAACG